MGIAASPTIASNATQVGERTRRIARQAAMQSRRSWLPVVEEARPFAEVAARPGACLAHRDGAGATLDRPLVLVGPEGGWSDEELAVPLPHLRLGPHVLRAETAAVAAAAVLVALRAGLLTQAAPPP